MLNIKLFLTPSPFYIIQYTTFYPLSRRQIWVFVNVADFPSAFAHDAQFFAERWKHHECSLDEVFKGCVLFVESAALEPRTQVGFGVERCYFIERMQPRARPHDWALFHVIIG